MSNKIDIEIIGSNGYTYNLVRSKEPVQIPSGEYLGKWSGHVFWVDGYVEPIAITSGIRGTSDGLTCFVENSYLYLENAFTPTKETTDIINKMYGF